MERPAAAAAAASHQAGLHHKKPPWRRRRRIAFLPRDDLYRLEGRLALTSRWSFSALLTARARLASSIHYSFFRAGAAHEHQHSGGSEERVWPGRLAGQWRRGRRPRDSLSKADHHRRTPSPMGSNRNYIFMLTFDSQGGPLPSPLSPSDSARTRERARWVTTPCSPGGLNGQGRVRS